MVVVPSNEKIESCAGSRVWTTRSSLESNATAIGCWRVADGVSGTGEPHELNSNTVESGAKELPGATAATSDPSGDTATSTGSTPANGVLTVTFPSAVTMVKTLMTAPLSGPHPWPTGRPTPAPDPVGPPGTPTPGAPAKQFPLASASTPGPASSTPGGFP